jgi:hypothetical protein
MYVLHEFEDAVDDCLAGDIFDNEATNAAGDSPHAWDEGWAFYAGSLEGTDGSGSGQLIHTLAEKRCKDFGTCCSDSGIVGPAKSNGRALRKTRMGRNKILSGDCFTVVEHFDGIVDQMTVPLIQGMLKYAFKADPANSQGSCTSGTCDKEWAEGWAFAAAVLPRLHYCSYEVADMVRGNLDVAKSAPMKDGFAELKAKVESLYPCLGITCADVGEFQNQAAVYTGMQACTDPQGVGGGDDTQLICDASSTVSTVAPSTAGATNAPDTQAPTEETTTADPPSVVEADSMAYHFAALSGVVFLVNA